MGAVVSAVVVAATTIISWFSASNNNEKESCKKFAKKEGITLYNAVGSPCSQRVRIAFLAKGLQWNMVDIDLLAGEQKSDEYLRINPQGRVPAVTFHNVQGVPPCTLVESNVITEFIDCHIPGDASLFPTDPWLRTQVKIWMDWEASLSEDFFPILSNNYLPFLLRFLYRSRRHFISSLPKHIPKNIRQKRINLYDGVGLQNEDHLKLSSIGCYRGLLKLERALEGQEFLVGGGLTVADLTVYPRLAMFDTVGLPIPEKDFPNTCAYLNRLSNVPCIRDSTPIGVKFLNFLFSYIPSIPVALGNVKAGKSHARFDGGQVIERVLGEEVERTPLDQPMTEINNDEIVLYEYTCAPESWQAQLLLYEKGKPFRLVERDFLETVARPHGSEGVFRIQHGDRLITGRRALLEYLDGTLDGKALIPSDPQQRSQVQMWQAWEQLMHTDHIYPLMETTLLPSMFKHRFTPDQGDDLLRLRSEPYYSIRFPEILRIYTQRWEPGNDILRQLSVSVGINLDRDQETEDQRTLEHHWELHRCLEHLDGQLMDKEFLVGDSLTVADICVYCRLLLMQYINMKISSQKYPNVARWMTALWERETFKQVATQATVTLDKYVAI